MAPFLHRASRLPLWQEKRSVEPARAPTQAGFKRVLCIGLSFALAVTVVLVAASLMLGSFAKRIEQSEQFLASLDELQVVLLNIDVLTERYRAGGRSRFDDRRSAEEAWSRADQLSVTLMRLAADDALQTTRLSALRERLHADRVAMDMLWAQTDWPEHAGSQSALDSASWVAQNQVFEDMRANQWATFEHVREETFDGLGALAAMLLSTLLLMLGRAWRVYAMMQQCADAAHADPLSGERLAFQDALIGFPNQRALAQQFEVMRCRADRSRRPLVMTLVDIDRLQELNQAYGHGAGDEVRMVVARRLGAACQSPDAVAWLSFDRLVCIAMPDAAPSNDEDFERLACAVSQPVLYQGILLGVSAFLGLARYPADGAQFADLLCVAKQNLARHKAQPPMRKPRSPEAALQAAQGALAGLRRPLAAAVARVHALVAGAPRSSRIDF